MVVRLGQNILLVIQRQYHHVLCGVISNRHITIIVINIEHLLAINSFKFFCYFGRFLIFFNSFLGLILLQVRKFFPYITEIFFNASIMVVVSTIYLLLTCFVSDKNIKGVLFFVIFNRKDIARLHFYSWLFCKRIPFFCYSFSWVFLLLVCLYFIKLLFILDFLFNTIKSTLNERFLT